MSTGRSIRPLVLALALLGGLAPAAQASPQPTLPTVKTVLAWLVSWLSPPPISRQGCIPSENGNCGVQPPQKLWTDSDIGCGIDPNGHPVC